MELTSRSVYFPLLQVFLVIFLCIHVNGSIIRGASNEDLHNRSIPQLLDYVRSGGVLSDSLDQTFITTILEPFIVPTYLLPHYYIVKLNDVAFVKAYTDQLTKYVENQNCKDHMAELFGVIQSKTADKNWMLQMLDSWGKQPEGLLDGHINLFGDFSECVGIHVESLQTVPTAKVQDFDGRYCTVYLADYNTSMAGTRMPVPRDRSFSLADDTATYDERTIGLNSAVTQDEFIRKLFFERTGVVITPSIGTCFPSSCDRNDIQQILVNGMEWTYNVMRKEPSRIDIPNEQLPWLHTLACYEEKKPDLDAADISVITLLATIMTLCVVAGVIDYWLNHGVAKPPKRGVLYNYLMAFSVYTNTRKWMNTRKSADDLGCLHGIRFFSTSWVVLAHTYYAITFLPSWNMIDVKTVYEDWTVLTVINSTFAVDTFFVLSGMLVAYNIFKVLDKSKGKLNIIMLYVHRYLRLTPTYAILIGIMATIIPYLGNGPYWAVMSRWGNICENNWWTNMLYVNNFVNTSWLCQGEAWYLANDMQFYVVSPFILYPMWRWEMFGTILLAIYTILSILCPALLVHYYDATPTTLPTRDQTTKWFTHIYIRPYARIQTFLVGVWLGWILHKTRGKQVKLPKIVVILGWAASTAIAPTVLYGIQDWFDPKAEIPKFAGLAYAGLSRVAWGVAVAWVMFACIKGYGGLVNSFLSWSPFMPLGRLCYCVYLVSLHLQMILHIRFTQPMRYDTYTQINYFFAHLLMSFTVGFFCTILFESPFMVLQKLIFEGSGGGGGRPVQDTKNLKRPSKRYGIFYNDEKTIVEGLQIDGTSAPSEKQRLD